MVPIAPNANDVNLDDDPYIPIERAPRYIPGRPHRATIWRWASRGIKRRGQTVRLKTIASGGRRFTTRDWIDAFLCACNCDTAPQPTPLRRHSHEVAAANLNALYAGK